MWYKYKMKYENEMKKYNMKILLFWITLYVYTNDF